MNDLRYGHTASLLTNRYVLVTGGDNIGGTWQFYIPSTKNELNIDKINNKQNNLQSYDFQLCIDIYLAAENCFHFFCMMTKKYEKVDKLIAWSITSDQISSTPWFIPFDIRIPRNIICIPNTIVSIICHTLQNRWTIRCWKWKSCWLLIL